MLSLNVAPRGLTDLGTALGSAAALALGTYRVEHGAMSVEALLIVLMAGTEIFRPLRDLRTVLHQGLNGQAAATGIIALLDTEVTAPATAAEDRRRFCAHVLLRGCRLRLSGRPPRRACRPELSRRRREKSRTLSGPSGAGKIHHRATAAAAARSGQRLRSGSAATTCATLDAGQLRGMIAVVAQDTYLFHGSVERTCAWAAPMRPVDEMVAAATAANAHSFISALPDGYQTIIGERGTQVIRRSATAAGDRPGVAAGRADPGPGRSAIVRRHRE